MLNIKDLQKELKEKSILVVISSEDYQEALKNIIKVAETEMDRICYVSLNQPYKVLVDTFKERGYDLKKFTFIDGITNTLTQFSSAPNCQFISAPNALTELSIAITKEFRKTNPNLIIFDSLSSLLIYQKGSILIEFVHTIIQTVRLNKGKILFTILNADIESPLMKDLSMFADKIIQA